MKRRAVAIAVVVFALWPLAHRALVATFDISPWKLGGWAMYSAPAFPVVVALYRVEGQRPVRLVEEELAPGLVQALRSFRNRRRTVGKLASPEELGRLVLERHPQTPAAIIAVQTRRLSHETALIETDNEKFFFQRE